MKSSLSCCYFQNSCPSEMGFFIRKLATTILQRLTLCKSCRKGSQLGSGVLMAHPGLHLQIQETHQTVFCLAIAKRVYHRTPCSGLKIRQPWLNKILSRQKTMELRGCATHIRISVGLVEVGSSTVLGKAELTDCIYIGKYVDGRWSYSKRGMTHIRMRLRRHRLTHVKPRPIDRNRWRVIQNCCY